MKSPYKSIKIKIESDSLTAEDLDDLQRWDDEGGHPAQKPNFFSSLEMPLHKKEIFEVVNSEIITENGQLYMVADLNILSLD